MKLFKSLLLLSASLLLVGCKNSPSGSAPQSSGDTQSESSSGHDDRVLHTFGISTYGSSFEAEFTKRTGFGGDTNTENRNKLTTYLGGPDAFIDSIVIPNTVTALDYGEMDSEIALALGGKSAYGTMNFTFNCDVDVIRLSVESYYKTYETYEGDPLNGLSLDTNSGLGLTSGSASDIVDLETTQEEGKKSTSVTFNLADKRSLTLENMSNDKGRVMIKYIYFEYWK